MLNTIKLLFAGLVIAAILAIGLSIQTRMKRSTQEEAGKIAAKSGVKSVADLTQEDEYYLANGADLHNIAGDLIGRKIRFQGTVTRIEHVPGDRACVLSDDKCYYVQLFYGSMMGRNIPPDLREQFDKSGLQVGDKVTLWCLIDQLGANDGLNALEYRSCLVRDVDKWKRGW